jgi:hypothetical protein
MAVRTDEMHAKPNEGNKQEWNNVLTLNLRLWTNNHGDESTNEDGVGQRQRLKQRRIIQFTTREISQTRGSSYGNFGVLCPRGIYIYREENCPPLCQLAI